METYELTPAHAMVYAQLLAGPQPVTAAEVAMSLPWPQEKCLRLLDGLESLGAASRIENGNGRVEYQAL